jgi:Flp pilus assembly protein TadG
VSRSARRIDCKHFWPRLAADVGGATAIEFAVVIALLAFIVLAALDFGRTLAARNEMSHALSRATRAVNLNPETTPEEITALLETALSGYATADLEVEIDEIDGTSYMRVSVSFPFHSSMPFRSDITTLSVSTLAPMVSPTL